MPEPIIGAKRYFAFEKETGTGAAWGTRPTTPIIVHAPVSEYNVKLVRNVFEHSTFTGTAQQIHAQASNCIVQGSLSLPLYGAHDSGPAVSLAQYFIELATDTPESLASRPSFRVWDMQCDGDGTLVAGHEDSGLRVNKMTLKGSPEGMSVSLDLIGKTQIAQTNNPGSIPTDRNANLEFQFSDTILTIGGSAVDIAEFSWEIDYGLKALFLNGTRPHAVNGQHCKQTLTFKPLKTAAAYDAYLRLLPQTELAAVLTIKGLHSGTTTDNYSQGVVTFARTSLITAEDAISFDDFGFQPITLRCLKPDTSANIAVPVWSAVA